MTENKQLVASAGVGIPAGQVLVWILETWLLGEPVPAEVAIAIGTLLGSLLYKLPFFKRKDWSHDLDKL